jgi:hypothetical protein
VLTRRKYWDILGHFSREESVNVREISAYFCLVSGEIAARFRDTRHLKAANLLPTRKSMPFLTQLHATATRSGRMDSIGHLSGLRVSQKRCYHPRASSPIDRDRDMLQTRLCAALEH